MSIDEAYRYCTRLTRRAARNFYYRIRLLPEHKRNALSAIYAFSRVLDDAVDDFRGEEARRQLEAVKEKLQRALAAVPDPDPVVAALGHAIRSFSLPTEPFLELIAGMEMDLGSATYETFEELLVYCRRVAGAVGRVCLEVFGYHDPEAKALADDMGVALQLTNILRDVREDFQRGRVYLPQEALRKHGVRPEDFAAESVPENLKAVLREMGERAKEYYRRADALFPLVSADARLCPMALHTIYRELLVAIEGRGFEVFGERVRLSTTRKLQLVGALFWRSWREQAGRA